MIVELSPALKNKLVEKAEAIADRVEHKRDQISQFRNLLHIAQVESEIPVLRNFVRYQAGRKGSGQLKDFWAIVHQPLISELEWIGAHAELQEVAHRRLALQRFFGYLVRHYVYLTGAKNKPADTSRSGQEKGKHHG